MVYEALIEDSISSILFKVIQSEILKNQENVWAYNVYISV